MLSLMLFALLAQDASSLVRETAYARVPKAKATAADAELVKAVKEKNQAGESDAEIQKKDAQWMASKSFPLRRELTTSPCARRLQRFIADDPIVVEALLMDQRGALVCASVETSDYWQGDEAKWQKTYRDGKSVFIDEPALDSSTGAYAIQLSLPVLDGEKRIGALTFTLKIPRSQLDTGGKRD